MFHVSPKYKGVKWKAQPRIPSTLNPAKEDSKTKRVCFAPTVEKCLLAIDGVKCLSKVGLEYGDTWYLYECRNIHLISAEGKVPDFYATTEHWSLSETLMYYVGKVVWENEATIKIIHP